MPPNSKSWNEYRRFVVEKLDAHSINFDEVFKRLNKIEVELAQLKIRAGVWGLLAGAIPVLIMLAIIIIRWKLQNGS